MLKSGHYSPSSTVAILYRTNAQSRLLEEACVNNNLPYVILGKATSFYKRREVKDCLCFLRWLYNGRDKGSMIRAFQTPSRGLGDKGIEQFEEYCSLMDQAYSKAGRARPTQLDILLSFPHAEEEGMPARKDTIATRPLKLFTEFARQMEGLREQAYSEPVEKVLAAVIDMFDLMAHFDKTSDSKAEFEERQSNVQELQQATRRYTDDGPCLQDKIRAEEDNNALDLGAIKSPLGAFLDDVALVTESANEKDENGGSKQDRFVVSLMTIHASKGMEYDGVFVTGCEDDNFPSSQAIQAGKGSVELAEECRLCYVAMTRAKSDLFMTWRKEAAVFTPNTDSGFRYVKRNRSRFLDALVTNKKNGEDSAPGGLRKGDQRKSLAYNEESGGVGGGGGLRGNGLVSPGRKLKSNGDARLRQRKEPGAGRLYSNGAATDYQERLNRVAAMSNPAVKGRTSTPPSNNGAGATSNRVRKATTAGSDRSIPNQSQSPSRPTTKTNSLQHRSSSTTTTTTTSRQEPPRPKTSPARDLPVTSTFASARQPVPKRKTAPAAMDSTWFYPVGSTVIHPRHGRGVVLNPPPPCEEMFVRVKFEGADTVDISAHGDDLRPDF